MGIGGADVAVQLVDGDLVLTDRWLVAMSNHTISAYPRVSAGAERAARGGMAAPKTGGLND